MRWLIIAIWSHLAGTPIDSPIADAIVTAVTEDGARGYVDLELEAATMAVYAWYESRLREWPPGVSWDARAGVSCGAWQEPCSFVRHASTADQARWWLRELHRSGLPSLDSSPKRAERRLRLAIAMTYNALAKGR